jgi:TonB family protein
MVSSRTARIILAAILVESLTGADLAGTQSPQNSELHRVRQGWTGPVRPVIREKPLPAFPTGAAEAGADAIVELDGVVGTSGRLIDAYIWRTSNGAFPFAQASLDAVRAWRFQPGLEDGRPVPVLVLLRLEFRSSDRSQPPRVIASTANSGEEFRTPRPTGAGTPFDPGAMDKTSGWSDPQLLRNVQPMYTPAAMRARLTGDVLLDAVILPDGTVTSEVVRESLDKSTGLDDEALKAVRFWRFRPATLNGQPVPASITIAMAFRLH